MKNTTRIFLAMGLLTLILGGGTASATYAWYQLNFQRTINLSGTSLGKSANISMGVISDVALDETYFSYSETDTKAEASRLTSGQMVYWFNDKKVSNAAVNSFLISNGYASTAVFPVTSGKYTAGDDLSLYTVSGTYVDFETSHTAADKDMYIHLPLIFKVMESDESTVINSTTGNRILLSELQVTGNFATAVRVYMKSDSFKVLVDPNNFDGSFTRVGGPMDLDLDGDFDYVRKEDGKNYEVCYGQHDSAPIYGDPYTDTVNTTEENYDCFSNPDHTAGVYPLVNTDSYVSKANYASMSSFLYSSGADKSAADYTPVCVTDNHGLGFLDLTIYLEGWDHSVVNQNMGFTFGTSITFLYAGTDSSSSSSN